MNQLMQYKELLETLNLTKKNIEWRKMKRFIEHDSLVKGMDSQSSGPMFKTTQWFQGRLSFSSF